MTRTVVGFSGNTQRPSKTLILVDYLAQGLAQRYGLSATTYDVTDLGIGLGAARSAADLDHQARRTLEAILAADMLVVGTPTYKGSYTGLFKHFFDLIDPSQLRGKPVLLAATGGGDRHALIVEHQLRPLFGFFEAFTLPTAVYATGRDFSSNGIASEGVIARSSQAIDQARALLSETAQRSAT